MAFEVPKEPSTGKVIEVTLGATEESGGTRSHTITLGGSNAWPFHFFEGEHPHKPQVAMEVLDRMPSKYPESLLDHYKDVIKNPADMAKKCVEEYGADLISIRLEGTHPEKGNKTADEAAETVKQVLQTVSVPLIISGHSHFEKVNEVMKKVCEATAGENCLINYVETDNYKTIAAACIAYNHTLVAQSPIDVNLAKQLNILLTDMNFPIERIVMDPLTGTLGYGLEYTYSIMERIRIDGLAGDQTLASPMLVNPGYETFQVKESRAPEEEYPTWGKTEERGIYWEAATAMSLLMTGAELLIMYHPKAVEITKQKIAEIYDSRQEGM
jgi:acetyl-CoA decarbonylase/synthase complex subunit delta